MQANENPVFEQRPVWIKTEEYPFLGEIQKVEAVTGKYGVDARLTLVAEDGRVRHFDAWSSNRTYMINVCGTDSKQWIGKWIHIALTEGNKRVLSLVLAKS